jgi:hypothetical protein
LTELGFEIPDHSFSNYDETVGSLSSTLNMDWVTNLVQPGVQDPDRVLLVDKLVNSQVRSQLSSLDYKVFTFENEFRWSLWTNADFYESPRNRDLITGALNSFELMYLENTIGRLVKNYDKFVFDRFVENYGLVNLDKYKEQTFILQNLPALSTHITPKFVYAHLTTTHVPYVFAADGSTMPLANQGSNIGTDFTDEKIKEGYVISIEYTNQQILKIMKEITTKDPDAIIIIQGDHGYPGKDRHSIFLAVYDKKKSIDGVDCLTPINLYRHLFNTWFGTDYPYLEDNLYATVDKKTYEYELIGTCQDAIGSK